MIGGIVVEVAEVPDRPDVLYVDCVDRGQPTEHCAVYVSLSELSKQIEVGDDLWWRDRTAYWTPQHNRGKPWDSLVCGRDLDIPLVLMGFSGGEHPSRVAKEDK